MLFGIVLLSACSLFHVKKLDAFSSFLHPSSGAEIEENGNIIIKTDSDEGSAAVGLLLYEAEPFTYLETLEWITEPGVYKGEYRHQKESGNYVIRLKLNSKPQNEYVDLKMYFAIRLISYKLQPKPFHAQIHLHQQGNKI